jgi:hypothetical protein
VRLTPHFHPFPQLRMSGPILLLPLYALRGMDRNYFNFTFTLNPQLLLLCTHRGTLQYQTHNALLTLYSPWHSAVSNPQCFASFVLTVTLCSIKPTMLCLLCTHRGTLQYQTQNALLPLYSSWHYAVSKPQCFAYSVLTVALYSIKPTILCFLCTHRGPLQYQSGIANV